MWYRLGQKIIQFRKTSLILLAAITLVMGYFATQVKLSYEFTKAIPEDNPTFSVYKKFVQQFGVDGTTMVVGFQSKDVFKRQNFNALSLV